MDFPSEQEVEMFDRKSGFYDRDVETMSPEERVDFEKKILKEAVETAYLKSPYMRKKFEDAGVDPESVKTREDLEKIPITRKSEFRRIQEKDLPFGGLVGVDISELKRVYVSPGPIYDPQGREEDHWRWGKVFYAAGFRKGDLVQNTFMYHMTPAGLMFDEALTSLGCTVIPAGVGNTEMQVQIMRELPVTGYVGTPSFLMTILKKAEEMGMSVEEELSLQVALVTAEKLPESMRKEFLDKYGVVVRQCYGTADVGALGYECYHADGMHVPDEIILEIVDPETGKQLPDGEMGEVVVTIRSNVYPLVRFGTGDLSIIRDVKCPCGRTSKKLAGWLGRVDQVTKIKGMFVHPGQVQSLEAKFDEVDLIQIAVYREGHEDRMVIQAVLKEGVTAGDSLKEDIEGAAREVLKLRGEVVFVSRSEVTEPEKKVVDRRKWD